MVQEEWNAYVFTLVFCQNYILCDIYTQASEAKLCLERILKLYFILSCEILPCLFEKIRFLA